MEMVNPLATVRMLLNTLSTLITPEQPFQVTHLEIQSFAGGDDLARVLP
jgi:hypothetical protein